MTVKKGLSSLVWDMANLFSNQIVRFILSVYLARLLEPEEFGVVGMAMVYIAITNMIIGFGFGASIVNKKEPKEAELSTIFFLNLFFGIFFSVLGFFGSPYIGVFYNNNLVGEVFQVLSIIIIIKSMVIVQNALLIKTLDFKAISLIQIVVNLVTAVIGVSLAYNGYGVWSLVIMNVSREVLYTLSVWIYSSWRPAKHFNLSLIIDYLKYGKDIFLSSLVTGLTDKLDTLLIGKYSSATTLGYYTRSRSFQVLINNFTGRSLGKVLFPILSREKDPDKINKMYWFVYKKTAIIVFLLIGVLYTVGDELFIVLFTKKWENSIPIFKILILAAFYKPFEAIFKSFIKGIGNSGMLLRSDIIKSLFLLITFIPLFWGNINLFLWLFLVHHTLAIVYNFFTIAKLSEISFSSSVIFTGKVVFIFIFAGIATKLLGDYFSYSLITDMIVQSMLYTCIFVLFIFVLFKNEITDLTDLIKRRGN